MWLITGVCVAVGVGVGVCVCVCWCVGGGARVCVCMCVSQSVKCRSYGPPRPTGLSSLGPSVNSVDLMGPRDPQD